MYVYGVSNFFFLIEQLDSEYFTKKTHTYLLYMQYVLHVFLLRRALEAAKFSCDLKAVYGRESARAFMARRPCVGAMAESSLGQGTTPRHRLAVSFPHRARCFKHSLVRLSPCADRWNRQGRAGGAQGKGCGRHARNSRW